MQLRRGIAVPFGREHVRGGRVVPRADERIRRTFRTVSEELFHWARAQQIEQAPREGPVPASDGFTYEQPVLSQEQRVLPEQRRHFVVALDSRRRTQGPPHVKFLRARRRLSRDTRRTRK